MDSVVSSTTGAAAAIGSITNMKRPSSSHHIATTISDGGPQEAKLKQYDSVFVHDRDALCDLGAPEHRDVVLPIDFHVQEQTYQKKIQYLTQQNDFLKQYAERILIQLKQANGDHELKTVMEYGVLGVDKQGEGEDGEVDSFHHPPWFSNEEYMSPLLIAYDKNIQEMQTLLERNRQTIEMKVKQTEAMALENEQLRV